MYLKSLEMVGFKSFAEAKIQFPSGITAVVGPNGAGKSNVVDAILWVLGEQSTKTLRGERMEDVIFNGTELRKPLGMAEVSLVIGGLGGLVPEVAAGLPGRLHEYQELMITRRLYRNGESEYLINKTPCRLKDIRSLLLDTRAGSKGHTVIEQGRIDQILNASPQERRELIEETAGIVRYKKQKAEALRKLESTQQNLLRVRDIIAEVKKQLNSLERQARQARSYQALQQEARALEIRLLADEYRTLRAGLSVIEEEVGGLEARESAQTAEQARLSAELETVKLSVLESGETINRLREALGQTEQEQARALAAAEVERNRIGLYEQQQAQAAHEIQRLAEEQNRASTEADRLRLTLSECDAEIAERTGRLAELEAVVRQASEQRSTVESEAERLRQDILRLAVRVTGGEHALTQLAERERETVQRTERLAGEQVEIDRERTVLLEKARELQTQGRENEDRRIEFQRARQKVVAEVERVTAELAETEQLLGQRLEELTATDSRLRTLEGVVREEMGYGRQGEEGTALRTCEGVREAIVEWLAVPQGLDRAIEAVLGERVRGWLVDDPSVACRAVEFLRQKDLGRGAFIPRQPRWSADRVRTWWPALAGEPGVIGRALDLVQAPAGSAATCACLLDGVVIVDTLEAAVRVWEHHRWAAPDGPTLVTLAGEIVDAAGVITGGGTGADTGLLQRRREVRQLAARREELVGAVETIRQRREDLAARLTALRDDEQRLADALREADMLALSLVKDEAGLRQSLTGLDRRAEAIAAELQRGREERQDIEAEIRSMRERLARDVQDKMEQEAALAGLKARLEEIEEESLALQHRLTDARLAVEGLRARRAHAETDLARLLDRQEAAKIHRSALDQQVMALEASRQQSRRECERQDTLCQELGRAVSRIKAELIAAQERQAEEMDAAQRLEQALAEVRQALTSVRELRMTAEVRRAELKTQLAAVENTLIGTYQLVPASVLECREAGGDESGSVPAAGEPPAATAEEWRQQLRKIRDRLDRMGPINLAAIEEHRELEDRYRFLEEQEQDLSNSIASLKEIIHRINRTTKEMFLATFNELQEKFGKVFAQFFPGGRAELVLVDEPPPEGTDPATSQEPGVDIVAQPPGKRLKSITMLSGGEKTLTAMALLFASFLIRPTPFCILDEIDAPLDEENIGRFTVVLEELARTAQFIVITHNKRTMSVADSLFGVTMEEPGVSKLVSVRLADLQPA
jgi:chromosome segregation protein